MCRSSSPYSQSDGMRSLRSHGCGSTPLRPALRTSASICASVFAAGCSALAREVLEEVVLVGRDRRAGEEDEEPDRALARGGERRDPAGLALPGETDAARIDPRLPRQEARGRSGVAGEHVDRARPSATRRGRSRSTRRCRACRRRARPRRGGASSACEVGQVGARRLARAGHPRDRRRAAPAPAAPSASRRASRRRCGSAPRSTGRGRAPRPCRSRARRRRPRLSVPTPAPSRRPAGADAVAGAARVQPVQLARVEVRRAAAGRTGRRPRRSCARPSGRGRRGPARQPTPARRARRRRARRV